MACAGLLLVSVLAALSANLPDAANLPDVPPRTELPVLSSSLTHQPPSRPINLSVPGAVHTPEISSSGAAAGVAAQQPNGWESGGAPAGINFGPLRAEFGGVTGHHMHLATVKLEGVSVFGGSVGGSIDSRSARITFSWPTSP